jgi:undecaprenyl-diphosphatase
MAMHLWQALSLALIQGVAELFPVSSLAQTILLPALLHWHIEQSHFLSFVVALHFATALALGAYFWRDWQAVLSAYLGSIRRRKMVYDKESKFAWLLVIGTLVVGGVGLVLEHKLRSFFENPRFAWVVAAILILNGVLMFVADLAKRRMGLLTKEGKWARDMTFLEGGLVGAAQVFALFPGISRSGVTIVSGLLAGLNYQEASRFAFMLATPVIGLAALLKAPEILRDSEMLRLAIPASLVAAVSAYLSVRFLMGYFKHGRLWPFALYCTAVGLISLVILFPS